MELKSERVNINPTWTHDDLVTYPPLYVDRIVMTDEIKAAAAAKLVPTREKLKDLEWQVNLKHREARGERSWRKNGGEAMYKEQLELEAIVRGLSLLAEGKNYDGSYGHITLSDAKRLLEL